MKKLISLALILCLILSLGINASAAESHTESATAIFRDIRILLHGRELIPCNEQGVTVEPFIIDGTTYLPMSFFDKNEFSYTRLTLFSTS